jgi:carboxyl-terminal processing protease
VALLLGLLAISLLCPLLWADPVGPSANDRYITRSVASLLLRDHLSKDDLNDEKSQRCLKTFLKSLDPWKVYFYQSDVDAFLKRQNDLDDMARKGDISFAYEVFQVFLKRIDERVKLVDELLAAQHDFTANEELISDRDMVQYPKTESEARDRWRKRIKYDLLVLKADGTQGDEAKEKLRRRYHSFDKRMHQTDGEELLEMYLTSLTSSFDPHTSYMSPSTLENFEIMMRLQLDGIGASLQAVDGYTVVKKIIPGGAADKQGELKVEDKIVGVGQGTDGEIVDTVDMKLSDVVKIIRGKRGTVVRLQVIPGDGGKQKTINITRAMIELKDSEAQSAVFETGVKPDGKPYKIGVIKLPSFYMDMEGARNGNPDFKSTTRDVQMLLEQFKANGVDAVILDLRENGGGSLTEAINLTGLFIDEGPVVQVKGRLSDEGDARITPYNDLNPGAAWSGPLIVLTSKFSASASEILAGAVQDYHRGLIVGDASTHGKGTVQSLTDLGQRLFRIPNAPPLGALKITMQQFYRPNGESTQKRGVVPDIELPSLTSHLDVGEADLDYPIEFNKVDGLEYKKLDQVNKPLLDRLRELSKKRCESSKDFGDVLKNINRYKEQKAKKTITLNEEKFLKERAELNAEKEEEKTLEKMNDAGMNASKRDYYLDEALAITVDYLNLHQVAKAR